MDENNDDDEVRFDDPGKYGLVNAPGSEQGASLTAMQVAMIKRCWPEMPVDDIYGAAASVLGYCNAPENSKRAAACQNMWTAAQNPAMAFVMMRAMQEAVTSAFFNTAVIEAAFAELPMPDELRTKLLEHAVEAHPDRVHEMSVDIAYRCANTLLVSYEAGAERVDELEASGLVDLQIEKDGGFDGYMPAEMASAWNGVTPAGVATIDEDGRIYGPDGSLMHEEGDDDGPR